LTREGSDLRVGAVILAAGSASRFGGGKLRADLDGRPVVRHVLDAALQAGLDPIVIVVPPTEALDGLDLAPARRVVNPTPGDGLSGSVRLGLGALEDDADATPEAAVILPGDQPRVRPSVIRALIADGAQAGDPGFVVPRYADDHAPNPVLAFRHVWRLADDLAGDHGFGPVLLAHPALVRHVDVPGANPDIDTREDLERVRTGREAPPTASDGSDVS
jgi:molybdenum cofactor cytidylyltransferase